MNFKRIFRSPVFWTIGAAVAVLGAGVVTLGALNPTMFAETAPDHREPAMRTRRYKLKGDIEAMRRTIEEIIPTIKTWGVNWKLSPGGEKDAPADDEIVQAEITVVVFKDDLRISFKPEGETVLVNVRSNSRIGGEGSDFGENRRHILQILERLDAAFGNAQP